MTRLGASLRSAYAAALCALALLAFAQVRSSVMQAAELAGAPMCGVAMAGMAGRGAPSPAKGHPACAYCAVAAHAPLVTVAARLPIPTSVAWSVAPVRRTLGARGPPAFRPRSRGPPALLLTA